MLKSVKPSHVACHVAIQDYLELDKEGADRTLSHDFINIDSPHAQKHWARCMDKTRAAFCNDRAWRGRAAVTYQHFVISPSPKDEVSIEVLRDLSKTWALKHFGDYEVALVAHPANSAGEPMAHMHIIVNNTNLDTGKRLQISKTMSKQLKNDLQNMARARGLQWFDNEQESAPTHQFAYLTKAERGLIEQKKYSYKQDLRNRIEIALRLSREEEGFLSELKHLGVGVVQKRAKSGIVDYVFELPENPRWKSTGESLGAGYTLDGIGMRMSNAKRGLTASREVDPKLRENVNTFIEKARIVASVPEHMTLADVAFVLKLNDRCKISTLRDYDARLVSLGVRMKKTNLPERLDSLKQEYGDVAHAKKIASQGDFFKDVAMRDGSSVSPVKTNESSMRRPMPTDALKKKETTSSRGRQATRMKGKKATKRSLSQTQGRKSPPKGR